MTKPFLNITHKIYIRGNYLKCSTRQMAELFGCSRSIVQKYMKKAKLKPSAEIIKQFKINAMKGKTLFDAEMDKFLIKNYLKIPLKPIAVELGVSPGCVYSRMGQLGLKVPAEIIEQRKKIGQFKSGHVPFTAGKKRTDYATPEGIAKMQKTQFKKGRKPHNTKDGTGHIVIRKDNKTNKPYKYVKLADGDWQLLHRVNYEKKNGPIPPGHVIRFKDGNTLNCEDVDNLMCITMAENCVINTEEYQNYPEPLKKAIKYKNIILKTLKNEQ